MENQLNAIEDADVSPGDDSRRDTLCIMAVICFAVLPDTYNAIAGWFETEMPPLETSSALCTWLIVRSIQVSAPTLLIVYLTGKDWESIGLRPFRWVWDPMWAIGIWAITTYISLMVLAAMPESWFVPVGESGGAGPGFLLSVAAAFANGFAEELVIRGYLLSKLERVLQSTWQAVLISTALFASYHVYQGAGGTIDVAIFGLLMAVAFCTLRRLWPLVLVHAFGNLLVFLTM
ncbi:MAG: hypothetical protein Aurels2KO_41380 [Aureliella sp.]